MIENKKLNDVEEDIELDFLDDEDPFKIDSPKYIFHCKPCYNFQSVEFDYEGDEDDIPEMMKLYEKIMNGLAKIAVAQPGQKPAVDSPSEKQFEIMDKYGIKYDPKTITKKEAQRLINESINK